MHKIDNLKRPSVSNRTGGALYLIFSAFARSAPEAPSALDPAASVWQSYARSFDPS
ncbi:MAG: hypothetical protein AAF720_11910 [Pseudomonadota bacterium]